MSWVLTLAFLSDVDQRILCGVARLSTFMLWRKYFGAWLAGLPVFDAKVAFEECSLGIGRKADRLNVYLCKVNIVQTL